MSGPQALPVVTEQQEAAAAAGLSVDEVETMTAKYKVTHGRKLPQDGARFSHGGLSLNRVMTS